MRYGVSRLAGFVLALGPLTVRAIIVELTEIAGVHDEHVTGEFTSFWELRDIVGAVDPIDDDCNDAGGKCIGALTRDGSLELNSKYGCTEPAFENEDDDSAISRSDSCGVSYSLGEEGTATISAINIALHPDSIRSMRVFVDNDVVVDEWEGAAGSEMQAIPGLEGLEGETVTVQGITETGDYFSILEVEIYIVVDEVEALGVSAATRVALSASATTDDVSAINTIDGDTTDASSWTCLSGEVCELTYDMEAVESLEQVRIAFSESTDAGGEFSILAAGESGAFSTVRTGLEAGRPSGSDGLQTFGGVRALARYVKIVVSPASGGSVVINEVELRVGEFAPKRPVAEKAWLKSTGSLPAGRDSSRNYNSYPNYDGKSASGGGCDSPGVFDGCHIFYIKDGDTSEDSRWSCGPAADGDDRGDGTRTSDICVAEFNLVHYRYVRQIQLAFHLGDGQHDEFSIEAYTKDVSSKYDEEWVTVVPSIITSGDTTEFQTFNVGVHTNGIRIVPKFQRFDQMINIKEMIILEKRKNAFIEGTVPVFYAYQPRLADEDDDDSSTVPDPTTRFMFDIASAGEYMRLDFQSATVTEVRLRFPADRTFVFDVEYTDDSVDHSERYTSAGVNSKLETFTLSVPPSVSSLDIVAVEGPTFSHKPNYPTLRVTDLQIVGEPTEDSEELRLVSTSMTSWAGYYNRGYIPDLITHAVADQEVIMTAICEGKGASFDGTDCVGELDDSTVTIRFPVGDFYVDGPIFMKSGVTLRGEWIAEFLTYPIFYVYDGPNAAVAGEDAVIVFDGVTDAEVDDFGFKRTEEATGPIVPGTVGNICLEVRNSEEIRLEGEMYFTTARSGAARFTDSSNITASIFWSGTYETGNYLEFTRVDDFSLSIMPETTGILFDTCNNMYLKGAYDTFELPDPSIDAPTGGDQTANVVITGESSGIVFQNVPIGTGSEPRILVESTGPLTLQEITRYEEAESGDCIVQVPEGSTEDSLIQIDSEVILVKSGNCWVLP